MNCTDRKRLESGVTWRDAGCVSSAGAHKALRRGVGQRGIVWPLMAVLLGLAAPSVLAQDMAPEAIDHVRRATVMVLQEDPFRDQVVGSGTGEFLNSNGLLITNNHVVDPNHGKSAEERARNYQQVTLPRYKIIVNSGRDEEAVYSATLLHQTESGDMALLQLDDVDGKTPETPHYLSFIPYGTLAEGMQSWIFGFPGGLDRGKEVAITHGLVTALTRAQSGGVTYVESDATAHPGNSGGPMVDADGRLVGIVTHKQFKERAKDNSGAVPAHLVQQFILSGFREGRIPKKADVLPFVDLFTRQSGLVTLPAYPREAAASFAHHRNGTVRRGTVEAPQLGISTTLGDFQVPLDRAAYLLVNNDTGTFVMEGGDLLAFPIGRLSIPFKFAGNTKEVRLADLEAVAFPLPAGAVKYPAGSGSSLVADGSRLSLGQVEGRVSVGAASFSPTDIVSIESERRGQKRVCTARGEQLRGELKHDQLKAATPWSSGPIPISLSSVQRATARPVNWAYVHSRGRRLIERLDIHDEGLKEIAELLDGREWQKAGPLLEKADAAGGLSRDGRKQLALFAGIERLRAGDFAEAESRFKKIRSKSHSIGWVAEAYLTVLEKHADGTFQGDPLSSPDVFWRASTEMAYEILTDADQRLERLEKVSYKDKAKELESLEADLDTANRLEIGIAQSKLLEVLEKAYFIHYEGYNELVDEYNQTVDKANRQRSSRKQRTYVSRLGSIERRLAACKDEAQRVYDRLVEESVGFVVEPPKFGR